MSIRLSSKHGVNAAVPICFFCGKPKNEVVLPGELPGDAEAPQHVVWDYTPCEQCAAWMKRGVILVSVRDGESGGNPYRTGNYVVADEEAIRRVFEPAEMVERVLAARFAFVEDTAWAAAGLPI